VKARKLVLPREYFLMSKPEHGVVDTFSSQKLCPRHFSLLVAVALFASQNSIANVINPTSGITIKMIHVTVPVDAIDKLVAVSAT